MKRPILDWTSFRRAVRIPEKRAQALAMLEEWRKHKASAEKNLRAAREHVAGAALLPDSGSENSLRSQADALVKRALAQVEQWEADCAQAEKILRETSGSIYA